MPLTHPDRAAVVERNLQKLMDMNIGSYEGSTTKQRMEKISSVRVTNDQNMGQRTHVLSYGPAFQPYADEQHTPRGVYNMGTALPYVSGKKTTPIVDVTALDL